jgi:hypothetical protein
MTSPLIVTASSNSLTPNSSQNLLLSELNLTANLLIQKFILLSYTFNWGPVPPILTEDWINVFTFSLFDHVTRKDNNVNRKRQKFQQKMNFFPFQGQKLNWIISPTRKLTVATLRFDQSIERSLLNRLLEENLFEQKEQ